MWEMWDVVPRTTSQHPTPTTQPRPGQSHQVTYLDLINSPLIHRVIYSGCLEPDLASQAQNSLFGIFWRRFHHPALAGDCKGSDGI